MNELPKVAPDIELHHVNLQLSSTSGDIGRWQIGKYFAARRAIAAAKQVIAEHGCDTLYYVPAPGKRIALWRDLLILRALRPHVKRLVLHWHASGLGEWLENQAWSWERRAAQRWLGQADLSIVLGDALRGDAAKLHPLRLEVIRNGIPDPCPEWNIDSTDRNEPVRALFVGLCARSKGVLAAVAGVAEANRRNPDSVSLTVAGEFPEADTEAEFHAAVATTNSKIEHVGFVSGEAKQKLFRESSVLLFPTRYPHEAHPLVILEALAHDLPVIVNNWKAVAEGLPDEFVHIINPTDHSENDLASALETVGNTARPAGALRTHFLGHYTAQHFVSKIAEAIR